MSNAGTINVNSPAMVRKLGIQALREALGTVGMVRFMQQFEEGSGDYTKEKYLQEDIPIETMKEKIKKYV